MMHKHQEDHASTDVNVPFVQIYLKPLSGQRGLIEPRQSNAIFSGAVHSSV